MLLLIMCIFFCQHGSASVVGPHLPVLRVRTRCEHQHLVNAGTGGPGMPMTKTSAVVDRLGQAVQAPCCPGSPHEGGRSDAQQCRLPCNWPARKPVGPGGRPAAPTSTGLGVPGALSVFFRVPLSRWKQHKVARLVRKLACPSSHKKAFCN